MGRRVVAFYRQHKAFILYFALGIVTTIANYAVYLPLYNFCNISATVSNIIAWIFSVIVAFLTNKPLVFRSYNWSKEVLYPEFLRFVICRMGTLLIESAIMLLLVDILRLNGNVTKLVVSILVVVGNFIASKYIVFRYKSK